MFTFLSFYLNFSTFFFASIILMFKWLSEPYPQVSELHQKADKAVIYQFLSNAPYSEFQKLNLRQTNHLRKLARGLTQPKGNSRYWIDAIGLLLRREEEIMKEEEMRKNGVMPDKKVQTSFLGQISTKISKFFKFSSTKSEKEEDKQSNDHQIDQLLLLTND